MLSTRTFFGHQSVGQNILEAVKRLSPNEILDAQATTDFTRPAIYHAKIGSNRNIPSKFLAFEKLLIDNDIGSKVDIAVMKLCYVDITESTPVEEVFAQYCASVQRIQLRFPKLSLVHCTIPLTVPGRTLRKKLRNWLKGDGANIQRGEYNRRVLEKFDGSPIFDIARIESTRPDGSRLALSFRNQQYFAADPQYVDGSGHLNSVGAERVAREFLRILSFVPTP